MVRKVTQAFTLERLAVGDAHTAHLTLAALVQVRGMVHGKSLGVLYPTYVLTVQKVVIKLVAKVVRVGPRHTWALDKGEVDCVLLPFLLGTLGLMGHVLSLPDYQAGCNPISSLVV